MHLWKGGRQLPPDLDGLQHADNGWLLINEGNKRVLQDSSDQIAINRSFDCLHHRAI
jgi:hypothetical protein